MGASKLSLFYSMLVIFVVTTPKQTPFFFDTIEASNIICNIICNRTMTTKDKILAYNLKDKLITLANLIYNYPTTK